MQFENNRLHAHHSEILVVWQSRYENLLNEVSAQTEIKNFLDIGANTGAVIQFFARHSKLEKVFAFEPVVSNVEVMKEILAQNLSNDVQTFIYPKAVYYGVKKAKAMTCGDNNTGGMFLDQVKIDGHSKGEGFETEIEFDCCTLEDVMPPNIVIDVCKIDVEGSEWNILKNSKFLRSNVRNVLLEYHWCDLKQAIDFCHDNLPEFDVVKHVEGNLWLKSNTVI